MAVPALIQALSGNSPTPTPTLTFTSQVAAGSLIVAGCVQKANAQIGMPTAPSVTFLNALSDTDAEPLPGSACLLAYAFNVPAGKPTITFPTAAGSAYFIAAFSNVQTASDPADFLGSATGMANGTITMPYAFTQANEVAVGALFSPANVVLTAPALGAVLVSQQSANGSLHVQWGKAPSITTGTLTFNAGSPAVCCAYGASWLHS